MKKNPLLKNHWANFKRISTKLDTKHPWVKGIQGCSNAVPRLSPWGDNSELVNFNSKYLKLYLSRTAWPISIKLGRKHPWVEMIQVNEGPSHFQRGYNSEIVKLYWNDLKIFCPPEPLGQFLPIMGQSILGWSGFMFIQMKGHAFLQGEIIAKM